MEYFNHNFYFHIHSTIKAMQSMPVPALITTIITGKEVGTNGAQSTPTTSEQWTCATACCVKCWQYKTF